MLNVVRWIVPIWRLFRDGVDTLNAFTKQMPSGISVNINVSPFISEIMTFSFSSMFYVFVDMKRFWNWVRYNRKSFYCNRISGVISLGRMVCDYFKSMNHGWFNFLLLQVTSKVLLMWENVISVWGIKLDKTNYLQMKRLFYNESIIHSLLTSDLCIKVT